MIKLRIGLRKSQNDFYLYVKKNGFLIRKQVPSLKVVSVVNEPHCYKKSSLISQKLSNDYDMIRFVEKRVAGGANSK